MKNVILYTDGACSGNPGIGGYAGILIYNGKERVVSGFEKETTNNRMELLAVIQGLKALKEKCIVDIYSDSAYVVNAFLQKWVDNWQNNGFKSSKGKVLNIELWQQLIELVNIHEVNWHKVKGHADNEFNNRCDYIARQEIEKYKKSLT